MLYYQRAVDLCFIGPPRGKSGQGASGKYYTLTLVLATMVIPVQKKMTMSTDRIVGK